MAHYAFLDENNIVTEVIVGRDEDDTTGGVTDWEEWYGNFRGQVCKRTSYNTRRIYEYEYDNSEPPNRTSTTVVGNEHLLGGTPFRGQYAGIGNFYDADLDEFVTLPESDTDETEL